MVVQCREQTPPWNARIPGTGKGFSHGYSFPRLYDRLARDHHRSLDREGLVWQDSLFYFELHLWLNRHATGPEDFPDFLEVDWIQLTGAEELLLGELQPRAVVAGSGSPGALLAAPVFSPCGRGR